MRYAGIGLVAVSCLYCGIIVLKEKKSYIAGLSSVCRALEIMQGELAVRLITMPALIKMLTEKSTDCARSFFIALYGFLPDLGDMEFAVLWERAAEKELRKLKDEERREIVALGSILGRYELSEQKSAINRCLIVLREHYNIALSEYPGSRKLCIGLSGAVGMLLLLVLI